MMDDERDPTVLGEWSKDVAQSRCHNCNAITLSRTTCPRCGATMRGVRKLAEDQDAAEWLRELAKDIAEGRARIVGTGELPSP